MFKALDERLRAGGRGGRFFFGERASSLDALLFVHLLYLQSAPVSAPELRSKVRDPISSQQGGALGKIWPTLLLT